MKKLGWMAALVLVMVLTLGASALAATAVAIDGKTYVFSGEGTTFEADGMTFTLEDNAVRIQAPGKADRVLPLSSAKLEAISEAPVAGEGTAALSATSDVATETYVIQDGDVDISVASSSATYFEEGSDFDDGEQYEAYAQFGLYYDAEAEVLYHQGKRVRIFEDLYQVDVNAVCSIVHFDPEGIVDVIAERDLSAIVYNGDGSYVPGGTVTGLRTLNDAEFASRDMSEWLAPIRQQTADAAESGPMTPAEKQAMYSPYALFGLVYDAQTDRLTYQGKSVRQFLDVQQSNGESFSGGRFKGSMTMTSEDWGEVDVTVVRDYARPDAQGNGAITGIDAQPAK